MSRYGGGFLPGLLAGLPELASAVLAVVLIVFGERLYWRAWEWRLRRKMQRG